MSAAGVRLTALLRKEALQIMRDPSALAIAFALPAFLLFIFGYGVTLDAKEVPLGVVVERPSADTAAFEGKLRQSPYFETTEYRDFAAAERALEAHEINGIVWLREDFSRRMRSSRGATIGAILNGVDANSARIVEGYLQQAWAAWLADAARPGGPGAGLPVAVAPRIRFNPEVRSRDYLIPGLIALVMTLTGALLTALVIAREWERGTQEALMVTRATLREILLAKLLPYFVLGLGGMAASVILAVTLFRVPFHGSAWALLVTSSLFLLAALGMGLLISTAARNQFVAGQIAIIATFLPAFILSGFVFDIGSMPAPIRAVTHVVAARYFVTILQTLFLAGDLWSVLLPNALALALMAALFLGVARLRARKRLD